MFLAETGLDKARLIFIRDNLKFEGLLEFSGEGRGGRVAVMWKKDVDVSVDTYSLNHIDAIINKGKGMNGNSPIFMANPTQGITIFLGPH